MLPEVDGAKAEAEIGVCEHPSPSRSATTTSSPSHSHMEPENDSAPSSRDALLSTGVEGLDTVLHGGLPKGEMYLVEGGSGTGKTILATHFLQAGAEAGERCLFVSLSQTEEGLRRNVRGAGLSLEGVEIHEHLPVPAPHALDNEQVVFSPDTVELAEAVHDLTAAVERAQPHRLVFDGIGFLRALAGSPDAYRRQILSLRAFFAKQAATVLLTNDAALVPGTTEVEGVAYGVICLSRDINAYGSEIRRLSVTKLRGRSYEAGTHDFRIRDAGLQVFPRLDTHEGDPDDPTGTLKSGVEPLDALFGGGLDVGSSLLIVGPSGTGKTTVATHYANAAAARGEASAVYLFDELPRTFVRRSETIGMPVVRHVEDGLMRIYPVSTGQLSLGEFAHLVRREVRERDVRVVVIDTLTGYLSAMPDERFLVTQMHDLLAYLARQGVLAILVVAKHGVVGTEVRGAVDVSYLADAVLLLRHFETGGALRRAISVYKKRYGDHENGIRELFIEAGGIRLSEPIKDYSGVLTGLPSVDGSANGSYYSDDSERA